MNQQLGTGGVYLEPTLLKASVRHFRNLPFYQWEAKLFYSLSNSIYNGKQDCLPCTKQCSWSNSFKFGNYGDGSTCPCAISAKSNKCYIFLVDLRMRKWCKLTYVLEFNWNYRFWMHLLTRFESWLVEMLPLSSFCSPEKLLINHLNVFA